MSSEWYFQSKGRRFGPITASLLKQHVEAGRVGPETLVRRDAEGDWVPAAQIRGLFKDVPASVPPADPPAKSAGPETPAITVPPQPVGVVPANGQVAASDVVAPAGRSGLEKVSRLLGGMGLVPFCLLVAAVALLAANLLLELGQTVGWRARWEYRIESPNDLLLSGELNELGADGWELVFARRASSSLTDGFAYEMIFKRRRRGTGGE